MTELTTLAQLSDDSVERTLLRRCLLLPETIAHHRLVRDLFRVEARLADAVFGAHEEGTLATLYARLERSEVIALLAEDELALLPTGSLRERLAELAAAYRVGRIGSDLIALAGEELVGPEVLSQKAAELTHYIREREAPEFLAGQAASAALEEGARYAAGEATGYSTGLDALDAIVGAFKPGQLVILGARPKMGKTALSLALALAAARQGGRVLFVSFELGKAELGRRLIAMVSRVPISEIAKGEYRATDGFERVSRATDELINLPLSFVTAGSMTLARLEELVRSESRHRPLDLVVVDLVSSVTVKAERRDLEVAAVSRSLKALAQDLSLTCLGVSQLNRDVERRGDSRPRLSDLRESGSLEQDADKVLLLYRPEYYLVQRGASPEEIEPVSGHLDVLVPVQRDGPSGEAALRFVERECRVEERW